MAIALLLLAAAPGAITSKDALLEFSYRWSSEARAVPALDKRFRADAAKQKASALATARADRAARLKSGFPEWNGHMFSRSWETAGQSVRLLSLEGSTGVFSGGAHGNSHTQRLLWDRKLNREVSIQSLLRPGTSWTAAIQQPFCVLLKRERTRRLEGNAGGLDWGCPRYADLPVVLVDRNRNGRFDHVRLTADPYVAGSYAEGEYVITLPLTATMLGRLKPEYVASFEPQPPVQ